MRGGGLAFATNDLRGLIFFKIAASRQMPQKRVVNSGATRLLPPRIASSEMSNSAVFSFRQNPRPPLPQDPIFT